MAATVVHAADILKAANEAVGDLDARFAEVAQYLVAAAKDRAPVVSGNLRDSIDFVYDSPTSGVLRANEFYAGWVELGLGKRKATPFMRRTIDETQGDVQRILTR